MNRSYPNAAGGLKMIFISEILSMVGAFLTMFGAVLAVVSMIGGGSGSSGIGLTVLALLLLLGTYGLLIFGLSKAGNDDANYNSAVVLSVAGLVIGLLNSLLITKIPVVGSVLSTLLGIVTTWSVPSWG